MEMYPIMVMKIIAMGNRCGRRIGIRRYDVSSSSSSSSSLIIIIIPPS